MQNIEHRIIHNQILINIRFQINSFINNPVILICNNTIFIHRRYEGCTNELKTSVHRIIRNSAFTRYD